MKIAVLGCGVMGSAFARQFAQKDHQLVLCDRNLDKGKALATELGSAFEKDPKQAVKGVEIVVLAIKPKDLKKMAASIDKLEGQLLLSILSSVTVETLEKEFPGAQVIRTMPNLALTCGESVIAVVENEKITEQIKATISSLLETMGLIFWTQEEKIDPITALAGSGPAFVIAIIEAMIESGVLMGLRANEARELVLQTFSGAVGLLRKTSGHPGEVRWQIAAPGGTTIAGLQALEEAGIRAGIMDTILTTYRRTKEMG